jgi:enolase-phosphatase E1
VSHRVRGLLLDIEGTTSPLAYVREVMFPFVRRELDHFLAAQGDTPVVREALRALAVEAGHASLGSSRLVADEVRRLMDLDAKSSGLKRLQGLIWEAGFASGELRGHVYDDVAPALAAWHAAGIDVRIYSSGSVQAQQLYFGHSTQGDLRGWLGGYYDTSVGSKREADSYRRIADQWPLPAAALLFCSDVVAELDAARTAGLRTMLVVRPENPPVPPGHGHQVVTSLVEIDDLG